MRQIIEITPEFSVVADKVSAVGIDPNNLSVLLIYLTGNIQPVSITCKDSESAKTNKKRIISELRND